MVSLGLSKKITVPGQGEGSAGKVLVTNPNVLIPWDLHGGKREFTFTDLSTCM